MERDVPWPGCPSSASSRAPLSPLALIPSAFRNSWPGHIVPSSDPLLLVVVGDQEGIARGVRIRCQEVSVTTRGVMIASLRIVGSKGNDLMSDLPKKHG